MRKRTPKSARQANWRGQVGGLAGSFSAAVNRFPAHRMEIIEHAHRYLKPIFEDALKKRAGKKPGAPLSQWEGTRHSRRSNVKASRRVFLEIRNTGRFFDGLDLNRLRVSDYALSIDLDFVSSFPRINLKRGKHALASANIWVSAKNDLVVLDVKGRSGSGPELRALRKQAGVPYDVFLFNALRDEAQRMGLNGLRLMKPQYNYWTRHPSRITVNPPEAEQQRIFQRYEEMARSFKLKDSGGAYWVERF